MAGTAPRLHCLSPRVLRWGAMLVIIFATYQISRTFGWHQTTHKFLGFTIGHSYNRGSAGIYEKAGQYVEAIMNPATSTLPRLDCPDFIHARYEYLRVPREEITGRNETKELKYLFAIDLRQVIDLLPRLIGSVVEVATFLGIESCTLSIVEGHSDDGTYEVLETLAPRLKEAGLAYYLQTSYTNPKVEERIGALAKLRNMALQPLFTGSKSDHKGGIANANTTVIFLNDVAACPDDILELVHQRVFQDAYMTCAMDWVYNGRDPNFYDVWISRTLRGDSFFNIPRRGRWKQAWNLFWNDSGTQQKYAAMLPFQVFSCWNGAVVFGAAALLGVHQGNGTSENIEDVDNTTADATQQQVLFRSSRPGECFAGEPVLFCKDLWATGHGRVAVVPTVNLEYTVKRGKDIKALKGFTTELIDKEDPNASRIEWIDEPPTMVKCINGWDNQTWLPWDE